MPDFGREPGSPDPHGDPYLDFLKSKVRMASASGFEVALEDINPGLKAHARLAVRWMLRGGRRAIFASFGLGKTSMQLEAVRIAAARALSLGRRGIGLIVIPLGVRQEFMRDAREILGWSEPPRFIRSAGEVDGPGVYLTNYETIREGLLDPGLFDATSLDEAAVLRSYGSKTYQQFLPLFADVPWRFVATATPAPNRLKEMIHYAGYLGVMDTGQALTRWFQRNSEKAGDLTLMPHKAEEFWLWVASWALFISKPSDLGCPDDGYDLPPMTVNWHEVEAGPVEEDDDPGGQRMLFHDPALGLAEAAGEKRASLPGRVLKAVELIRAAPDEHAILWHDLEDERAALEQVLPQVFSVWGTQELGPREDVIVGFSNGWFPYLSTKPVLAGSGCNFQRHCAWEIFVGVTFKFHDFIQAVHRVWRFGQTRPVRIDIVFSEREREVVRALKVKWEQHNQMVETMKQIVRDYDLSAVAMAQTLQRSIGVERVEASGRGWRAIHNDCVVETRAMPADSVDEIVTSIPFANQYEYTPSYNDFGHTTDNAEFWRQMDHLIPELLRVLKPGRIAAIHVKDRMLPGSKTGAGCYTVEPFHMETYAAFVKHGWLYMGLTYIETDVVRENNQTYRLSYSEMLNDSTKMGSGGGEYLMQFRKPQSDLSKQYADERVVKSREAYSLARWQQDAAGRWRSSGNRLTAPHELAALPIETAMAVFRREWIEAVYDYEVNVAIGEEFAARGKLPMEFMAFSPPAWSDGCWTDVTRMRTLNMDQASAGREKHVCPLQFDIVDRAISRWSNPGEVVFDPFGGLGTVSVRALKLGRQGLTTELNPGYWADSLRFLSAMENELATPDLFDLIEVEEAGRAA